MKNNLFYRVTCVASRGWCEYLVQGSILRAPRLEKSMLLVPRTWFFFLAPISSRIIVRNVCNPNVLQEGRKMIWKRLVARFSRWNVFPHVLGVIHRFYNTWSSSASSSSSDISLSSLKERKRRRPYIAVVVVPYRSTHTGLWTSHRSNRIVVSYDRSSIILLFWEIFVFLTTVWTILCCLFARYIVNRRNRPWSDERFYFEWIIK